jgi:exosortase D (VPLPA-CTERM-specific)
LKQGAFVLNMQSGAQMVYWKEPPRSLLAFSLAGALLILLFREGFDPLFAQWFSKEEYSHAVMLPFICAFLIWQKKDVLERTDFTGSWWGVAGVLSGILLLLIGKQSALVVLMHYGFLCVLYGLALSYMGWKGFRVILVPLLVLFFMIPLPGILYSGLSNQLQLISSQLGVSIIRLFGITVHLTGNVIDLGSYKLQVVEACSGLRYLFPLVTLGFIAAYFFKGALWKRVLLFLSSLPITVLMNSFRVGVIGVLVEYWGQGQAEGFLHAFEGWVVFMLCMVLLIAEMWLLARIGNDGRPLTEVFGLEFPEPTPESARQRYRALTGRFQFSVILLLAVFLLSMLMPAPAEIIPERKSFVSFPYVIDGWKGRFRPHNQAIADSLRYDDYVKVDYRSPDRNVVNFFATYYKSQISGTMPHSPRACLPGGGWIISEFGQRDLGIVTSAGVPLVVNRSVIELGDQRQVVYYWFQQRGRSLTSEYHVKWFIFWDSIVDNRSDGALVRFSTMLNRDEELADGDRRLQELAGKVVPLLSGYLPD